MSGEGLLPNDPCDPRPILVALENGTALQFSGPAAQLLRRDAYCDFLAPSHQEPDVND